MRVLIVDYSIRIVERLEEMLSAMENITCIYTAVSYETASNLNQRIKPDIILLDICLPANNSFKILREAKAPGSTTHVIIMAVEKGNYVNEQCNLLGADFFFDKYSEFQKIPAAVRSIMNARRQNYYIQENQKNNVQAAKEKNHVG
jgi:DNA-binding NarL/FixJ family response regulator